MYSLDLNNQVFLIVLIFTITIEIVVLFLLVRHLLTIPRTKISNNLLIFSGFFVSVITLPFLWFLLPKIIHNYYIYIFGGEIIVILIEGVLYFFLLKIGLTKSLLISCLCNLTSFAGGIIFNSFIKV